MRRAIRNTGIIDRAYYRLAIPLRKRLLMMLRVISINRQSFKNTNPLTGVCL